MSLSYIKISHFRTHELSVLKPTKEPIVIFGKNGVGKTNVLEAISMFAPGQGFRRSKFSELARRPGSLGWKLVGQFQSLGSSFEVINYWNQDSGRKILIDGKNASQSELASLVRILWITPVMDRIWLNGSAERRRFLDRIVSNLVPGHTENSIKYYKALKQRNKLIKEKILDSNWYDALEKQMAVSGAEIDKARSYVITYIMDMQKKSVSSFPFAELSIVGERYLTPQTLEMALCKNRKQDIYAGRTLIGPHLSDLSAIYSSKGVSARSCSTGEQKALLISIIIATAKIQIEVFNTSPILLLDEVSAHLDTERRNILYDELNDLNLQLFLTGTDINIFSGFKKRARFYEVEINSNKSVCTLSKD